MVGISCGVQGRTSMANDLPLACEFYWSGVDGVCLIDILVTVVIYAIRNAGWFQITKKSKKFYDNNFTLAASKVSILFTFLVRVSLQGEACPLKNTGFVVRPERQFYFCAFMVQKPLNVAFQHERKYLLFRGLSVQSAGGWRLERQV